MIFCWFRRKYFLLLFFLFSTSKIVEGMIIWKLDRHKSSRNNINFTLINIFCMNSSFYCKNFQKQNWNKPFFSYENNEKMLYTWVISYDLSEIKNYLFIFHYMKHYQLSDFLIIKIIIVDSFLKMFHLYLKSLFLNFKSILH